MPPSRYEAWLSALPEFDPTKEGFFLYAKRIGGLPNLVLRCYPTTQIIYAVENVATNRFWYVDQDSGKMILSSPRSINMTSVLADLGLESWTAGQWNAATMRTNQILMAWQPAG